MNAAAVRNIIERAMDAATRRDVATRIFSKVTTHLRKYTKLGNLLNLSTNIAVQAIPIPGVGSVVAWTEEAITKEVRRKIDEYHQKNPKTPYKKMKFDIKTFDLKQIDTARHKLKKNITEYNNFAKHDNKGEPACIRAYKLAYRYYRIEYRADRLEYLARAMMVIVEEILDWCQQVRQVTLTDKNEQDMCKGVAGLLEHGDHKYCKNELCVQKEFNGKTVEKKGLLQANRTEEIVEKLSNSVGNELRFSEEHDDLDLVPLDG